ncbi:PQQ-binding-like beta-propeller repeat protein [Granulicella sp. WH15]|uniref:outer membrane protein assembly factor BamB family protein n=1 Tax=Granulicella sp. WH15 TaxID=2602070 RepID=UPI001366EE01|nr:PQQ-binding-like beta-propeller repeat protein [Granulicella sp. WH15]QHN02889.1 PQQ-binding-like beta-propeller repeat protein [Granulicella sp. WH15]
MLTSLLSSGSKTVKAAALALAVAIHCNAIGAASEKPQAVDWPVYGGTENQHYSPLKQINTANVSKLKLAWTYDSGEKEGGLETSPIIVGDAMYACTPSQKIIKLNAATGELLWKFASGISSTQPSRGVSYWTDGKEGRVLAAVMNYLYALDPKTGKPIASFGENGRIDLRKGLRGDYRRQSIALTTPGTIYKDLIIVSGRNPEAYPAPPGHIRAFDVRTGALRWTFHTIPHPGEAGYETWPKDAWKYAGAANNWSGMSIDKGRGILYVPTGSAVFDFYGGDRIGNDLFADSLLALDAATGKLLWHFQEVHHDIWDRDLPAPPALVTVQRDGKMVDAVVQTTKQGYVYVFDRVTGKPLFPIEEVKVPASEVPGEVTSPTQPRPVTPAPYARQMVTLDDLTTRTPEAHAWAVEEYKKLLVGDQFTPLSDKKIFLLTPGFDGGAEWGGAAVDPVAQVMFTNANNISWLAGLTVPPPSSSQGETLYRNSCSMCHGMDRAGQPPAFPSLLGVQERLTDETIEAQIRNGKGRMPSFPNLSDAEMKEIIHFLKVGELSENTGPETRELATTPASADEIALAKKIPYKFTGYKKFLDPEGYPAVASPWGTLNAIDLKTGKYLWRIPLGEYPELVAKGLKDTGSENYGGPVMTAGGVLFIAATVHDEKLRAFDARTGKLLWETKLPYAGMDTPATYMVHGKQYVVIGAGGGKETTGNHRGGVYVAYSLQE